jgi:hypothetical protein
VKKQRSPQRFVIDARDRRYAAAHQGIRYGITAASYSTVIATGHAAERNSGRFSGVNRINNNLDGQGLQKCNGGGLITGSCCPISGNHMTIKQVSDLQPTFGQQSIDQLLLLHESGRIKLNPGF